jgi:hypothetical protein
MFLRWDGGSRSPKYSIADLWKESKTYRSAAEHNACRLSSQPPRLPSLKSFFNSFRHSSNSALHRLQEGRRRHLSEDGGFNPSQGRSRLHAENGCTARLPQLSKATGRAYSKIPAHACPHTQARMGFLLFVPTNPAPFMRDLLQRE